MLKWLALCAVGVVLSGLFGAGGSPESWSALVKLMFVLAAMAGFAGWAVGSVGGRGLLTTTKGY